MTRCYIRVPVNIEHEIVNLSGRPLHIVHCIVVQYVIRNGKDSSIPYSEEKGWRAWARVRAGLLALIHDNRFPPIRKESLGNIYLNVVFNSSMRTTYAGFVSVFIMTLSPAIGVHRSKYRNILKT